MAATVTARSGHHVAYYRQQAAPGGERSPLGYYSAGARQGEAPGRWFGCALPALGLAAGQVVDMEDDGPYIQVYGQVNPLTGERLGRAPRTADGMRESILAELEAVEPHATRERHWQLARQAAHQAHSSAPYTDVTVSWSKSISLFHASIRENERLAREAGDDERAAHWATRDRRLEDILQEANLAGLRHAEEWAGVTRTGYHGRKVDGQETGRWERAAIAVTSWLQGTSRDGDPHDHEHNLFARMTRTDSDGRWRALDTMALRHQLPAMQAIVTAHAEAAMTREWGITWVAREDGAGNEIRGITQAQMDEFSSRAQDIAPRMEALVRQFTADYGRAPNRAEMRSLHDEAWDATRADKDKGGIDWDALTRKWDAQIGGALARIAPAVAPGPSRAPAGAGRPSEEAIARAARAALARVQTARATWTRADYLKYLGLCMPAESRDMEPAAAVALLHETATRALAGEFEDVIPMSAPEWPALPDYLVRGLDGRNVYRRPGSERYATRVQLTQEERLIREAERQGGPRLTRADAAALIGADADELDAQLRAKAQDARSGATRSGLRLDQGAALYHVLTSPRTAEVLVGPAGSGKTHTLVQAAWAWQAHGGQVIGLATSQGGRNVLANAGVPLAENTSVFLGHSPGQRGARGIRDLPAGSLILMDEASMTSTADLADIIGYAAAHGHKVIVCGDHAQLAAVESGGGMQLLVGSLGHVQLAEAVRFREEWEQDASLRLREGDATALENYDSHGRIRGGSPDDAMADARRLYVSHYVQGRDAELIVSRKELGREMARQIRSDLRHLGLLPDGPEIQIARGQQAGVGDVIRATRNHHRAGVANGDILRIEAVNEDGSITVRRGLDRDGATGLRRWADDTFRWRRYGRAESGLWATAHTAQGRTVTAGITLVTGSEDAQWLYSAMTRGADTNIACVFTHTHQDVAEGAPRSRPDPELGRNERIAAERAGLPVPQHELDAPANVEPADPGAVLAGILERDGRQRSALAERRANLANVDHLGRLGAIWEGETAGLRTARYRQAVREWLPEGLDGALDSYQATWLWRSLRAAEAAGLDAREVARRALEGRTLAGARDIAAVIDARIRHDTGALVPSKWRPWSEQVPIAPEPERKRYLQELAAAMDARKERIGEFAAETSPAWAVNSLGQVPSDPLDRLEWQQRAAHIGAYREMYGWDHDSDPIGMEPAGDTPEKRAAWHAARAAATRTDQVTIARHPDSRLHLMRDTYRAETSWAPQYPGERLRALRGAAIDTAAAAARSDGEAAAARERGENEMAARHEAIAASARQAGEWYRQQAAVDEITLEDYRAWSRVTEGSRHLAVLADSELRRRHPGVELEPLRSAEPRAPGAELPPIPATEAEPGALPSQAAQAQAEFRERLEARQGVMVPAEDPDWQAEGEAWPAAWPNRDRDAVLQPPKPEMRPAPEVEREAAAREVGE